MNANDPGFSGYLYCWQDPYRAWDYELPHRQELAPGSLTNWRCPVHAHHIDDGENFGTAEIWEDLLEDEASCVLACEELAMYHERRTRNFAKAIEFAGRGLKALRNRKLELKYGATRPPELRRMERLSKRVARLEQRAAANREAAAGPLLRRSRAAVVGI